MKIDNKFTYNAVKTETSTLSTIKGLAVITISKRKGKRKLRRARVTGWFSQLSVEPPTSAQVMISQWVGSSPMSGSGLTAQSLEPASDSVSPPLSAPPMLMICLALSLYNK